MPLLQGERHNNIVLHLQSTSPTLLNYSSSSLITLGFANIQQSISRHKYTKYIEIVVINFHFLNLY